MPITGEYKRSTWEWAAKQAEQYEASGGREANTIVGKPIVLLTTVGRKTGSVRKSPVMRVEHDGEYAVIASKGGSPDHPAWYLNLVDEPHVMLQDGDRVLDLLARQAEGEERELWWQRAVEAYPPYAAYQLKTTRRIPVIVFDPLPG